MNIVDDFIGKEICPYCGNRLKPIKYSMGNLRCEKCKSYFQYIDSMGADGYYFPREPKKGDYCLNSEEK